MNRARQKRTMADMRTIALGIDSYETDVNGFPAAAGYALPSGLSLPTATIGAIVSEISPTYLRTVPLVDGWNSWFTYGTDSSRANYAIRSNGADGTPDASPPFGETHSFYGRHHSRQRELRPVPGRAPEMTSRGPSPGARRRQTLRVATRVDRQKLSFVFEQKSSVAT